MILTITPSEMDKAYAAGIVDGEGCIHVYCGSRKNHKYKNGTLRYYGARRYAYLVKVNMVDHQAVRFLASRFGGNVRLIEPPSSKKYGYKPQFKWELNQRKAAGFLRLIYPYLQVKKEKAGMVLELAAIISRGPSRVGRGYKLSDHDKQERDVVIERIKKSA